MAPEDQQRLQQAIRTLAAAEQALASTKKYVSIPAETERIFTEVAARLLFVKEIITDEVGKKALIDAGDEADAEWKEQMEETSRQIAEEWQTSRQILGPWLDVLKPVVATVGAVLGAGPLVNPLLASPANLEARPSSALHPPTERPCRARYPQGRRYDEPRKRAPGSTRGPRHLFRLTDAGLPRRNRKTSCA